MLLVNNELPVRTLAEFLALARSKPGALNFGSTSLGGSPHMSGELLKLMAKVDLLHVPYKGAGPMLIDLMGGQITAAFDNLPSAMAHVKGGKVRALAVTTSKRWPTAPDIPTMAEAGVPGYEMSAWFGLLAPPGMARPVAQMLQHEVAATLREPEITTRLLELGADPGGITPEEFGRFLLAEREAGGDHCACNQQVHVQEPELRRAEGLHPRVAADAGAAGAGGTSDFPARNVAELIALARARPKSLSFASSGNGQSTHLSAELFASMAGAPMTHVPYKGSAPALNDLIAGHVPLMFDTMLSAMPHVKGGKLRALATTAAQRRRSSLRRVLPPPGWPPPRRRTF